MVRFFQKMLALTATACCLLSQAEAQTGRYISPVFNNVTVTTNVQYGSAVGYGATQPSNMLLDIYEPAGDTATLRPLVIAVYGGSFIGGSKEADDIQAWCDTLAQLGYVAVAHNYRVGFNPLAAGNSIVRAGYRAIQDTRAAVRFMKEYATTYRIDTNQIFMVGNSAGSITAIQSAFISDANRPIQTYGIQGSNAQDTTDQLGIDESTNSFVHTVNVKAIVGLWGAVLDTALFDSNDSTALLLIHGDADSVVPIDAAPAFYNAAFPTLYGSRAMVPYLNNFGIYNELEVYAGQDHNFYYSGNTFPNAYWDTLANHGINFLCRFNTYCDANLINVIAVDKAKTALQPFRMFPNPAHSELTVVFDQAYQNGEVQAQIFNLQGQLLNVQTSISDQQAVFGVSELPNGVYLLHIQTPKGFAAQKFIVQK